MSKARCLIASFSKSDKDSLLFMVGFLVLVLFVLFFFLFLFLGEENHAFNSGCSLETLERMKHCGGAPCCHYFLPSVVDTMSEVSTSGTVHYTTVLHSIDYTNHRRTDLRWGKNPKSIHFKKLKHEARSVTFHHPASSIQHHLHSLRNQQEDFCLFDVYYHTDLFVFACTN